MAPELQRHPLREVCDYTAVRKSPCYSGRRLRWVEMSFCEIDARQQRTANDCETLMEISRDSAHNSFFETDACCNLSAY